VWAQKASDGDADKRTPSWYGAVISQKWTGDLDEIVKRRTIRALVVYSQSGYFVDKGTQRGASYQALVGFEGDLNKQLKTKNLRVNVVFIPVKIDDLIPALTDGRGDIAAAFVTITPGRDKLIDFSDPLVAPINEVVVSGPNSPNLRSLDDLSGKEVFVHKSSSYYEHLQTLNDGAMDDLTRPYSRSPPTTPDPIGSYPCAASRRSAGSISMYGSTMSKSLRRKI
jgi:ABC-type amino acid transport substrate-binding protein